MVLLFLYRWKGNGSILKSPTGFYHTMLFSVQWFSGQGSAAVAIGPQTKLRYSYVEGIAMTFLRSISRSCWLLRNIYVSNDKCIFYFLRIFPLFYHWQYLSRSWLYIWVTRRVSYKKREFRTLPENLCSSLGFDGIRSTHHFNFLCFLFCLSSTSVMCNQHGKCFWNVHSWLHLRFSLTFI